MIPISVLIFASTTALCSFLPNVFGAPGIAHNHNHNTYSSKNHGHSQLGEDGHGHGHAALVPLTHNHIVDYYAPPRYSYTYGVNDPHTHDMKTAYETRDGDYTHGRYSVMQPDGILRVVTYTADPWRGFQADVKMLNGYAKHPPQHYYSSKPIPVVSAVPIHSKEIVYRPHYIPNVVKTVVVKSKIPVAADYGENGQGEVINGQGHGQAPDYY